MKTSSLLLIGEKLLLIWEGFFRSSKKHLIDISWIVTRVRAGKKLFFKLFVF
jgi:hypothetical protein